MRALYSIRPKWVGKILNKEKRWEIRKDCPSRLKPPFTALIYCMQGEYYWLYISRTNNKKQATHFCGKVVGEFVCDEIVLLEAIMADNGSAEFLHKAVRSYCNATKNHDIMSSIGLSVDELYDYLKTDKNRYGYALHIRDLKIYDKPKELSEFSKVCPYYDDCENCKHKSENCKEWREIKRPPQSWGYIR